MGAQGVPKNWLRGHKLLIDGIIKEMCFLLQKMYTIEIHCKGNIFEKEIKTSRMTIVSSSKEMKWTLLGYVRFSF